MKEIRNERIRTLQETRERQADREVRDVATKQNLALELFKYGGLWTTTEEVDEQLQTLDQRTQLLAVSAVKI